MNATTQSAPTLVLTGRSGSRYQFRVYSMHTTFKALPGVYVVSCRSPDGKHAIKYVGQTQDLSERFDAHHKWPAFLLNRCTSISVMLVGQGEAARLAIERDLIASYDPSCNG
jgi:predicted GIY-YIG superfamily endonuclease